MITSKIIKLFLITAVIIKLYIYTEKYVIKCLNVKIKTLSVCISLNIILIYLNIFIRIWTQLLVTYLFIKF